MSFDGLHHSACKVASPILQAVTLAMLCSCLLASTLGGETFRVRGVAGLPAQFRMDFAELADPLWYLVEDEEVSVEDAVSSLCGDQGPTVHAHLVQLAAKLNRVTSAEAEIPSGYTVAVPFCFKIDGPTSVPVEEGDTVEGLLKEHYGVFGPKTQDAVYRLNAPAYPGLTRDQFMRHIRPGRDLVLPHVSEERTFTWTAGAPEEPSPFDVVEQLPRRRLAEAFAVNLEQIRGGVNPFLVQNVPFVEAESLGEDGACGVVDHAWTVEGLASRYEVERAAMLAAGGGFEQQIVGVIDTGLARNDPFFERLLLKNPVEDGEPNGKDDDRNGFKDDVFGVGLEGRNGFIYSSPTDDPPGHGTKVTTIVATGLDFEVWQRHVAESPLGLKMVSYSSQRFGVGVDPTVLALAPKYLQDQKATIVNMSLSTFHKPWPLSYAIEENSELLFVVAAGNVKSGEGKRLGPKIMVYPALFGGRIGDFADRVLTVGAHDETGSPARFSNFSEEHVDLLAPGCSVKTRDEQGATVREHGTSIATAAVSFTAALVRSLGLDQPVHIKNRLLVASDFDPELITHAWSASRLNPRKAISLRHDVLEVSGKLYFGRLQVPNAALPWCKQAPPIPLEGLRKITPNLQTRDQGMGLKYWVEPDEKIYRETCTQAAAVPEVEFLTDGGELIKIPLSDVKEIVLARF